MGAASSLAAVPRAARSLYPEQNTHPHVSAARPGLAFGADKRMRRKAEFDHAFARGRRFSDAYFTMTVCSNARQAPRLGLAIAARSAGNAVERNRVRRIVRESFRLHARALPAVDIIVATRTTVRSAASKALRSSLEVLWLKVATQWAR